MAGGAAEAMIGGGGVEAVGEQLHVFIPLAVFTESHGEAGDGQVGDGEEAGENDAVVLLEFPFIVGLQVCRKTVSTLIVVIQ